MDESSWHSNCEVIGGQGIDMVVKGWLDYGIAFEQIFVHCYITLTVAK